ncbi:MAG TPA: universal stress protein [Actinoplanes sp.]|jgi:hypothetical protein
MSPSTILPDRNTVVVQQVRRSPERSLSYADVAGGPLVVPGTGHVAAGGAVAAAVNDDSSADVVVRYASAEAHRLNVPLRVVHVWTSGETPATGARMLRHDRMCDADGLLATVLYEALPTAEADVAEREILHDPDPVRALTALSPSLSLLVVAGAAARGRDLGGTPGGLLGRTACPLAVVPAAEESATW